MPGFEAGLEPVERIEHIVSMDDPNNPPVRSAGSEMCGLLLLVPAIGVVFYLLDSLTRKASRVFADMLPEGTPLPVVTRIILDIPFTLVGGVLALLVVVFAFTLRKKLWVQRHLVLLVSLAWFGMGCLGLLILAALALPASNIITGLL